MSFEKSIAVCLTFFALTACCSNLPKTEVTPQVKEYVSKLPGSQTAPQWREYSTVDVGSTLPSVTSVDPAQSNKGIVLEGKTYFPAQRLNPGA